MMFKKQEKCEYLEFDPAVGWPAGDGIFYECEKCSSVVSTTEDGGCDCHNLYVDASCGRIGAKEPDKVRPFRVK